MSASKNKQAFAPAEKLTERQISEQKEAQKLKIYTGLFVGALALIVVLAVGMGIGKSLSAKAERDRVQAETSAMVNTVAAKTGSHDINSVEMNYAYVEYVNNYVSSLENYYGNYASIFMGFDKSVDLKEQIYDEESGKTWADYFMDSVLDQMEYIYALCDAAEAEGYTLPAEDQQSLDLQLNNIDNYARLYNVSTDTLLQANYGIGATRDSYAAYCAKRQLASSFENDYQGRIEITAEEISERDAASPESFTNYSFNQYYLPVNKFLTGGTAEEEGGVVTYSDEEKAEAAQKAEEAAKMLSESASVEELDIAISNLEFNADTAAASTECSNYSYSSLNSYVSSWVSDPAREAGDCTSLPVVTTNEDSEETTAYYIVYFTGANTNETEMINVRHILVGFSGEQAEDGTYTQEAREAAKNEADRILTEWNDGDKTEDSFAALAAQYSTDTGSSSNGGLYEDVFAGQMVPAFNDWCFDASRTAGDTGIVETEYGYHVMYFVGTTGETYRHHQIADVLENEKMEAWREAMIKDIDSALVDTSMIITNSLANH